MIRSLVPILGAVAALALSACGGSSTAVADGTTVDGAPPAAGMCHESQPDCVDTVVDRDGEVPPDDRADAFDSHAAVAEARALLGDAEGELSPEVRVGRRGEELFALTEDYRIGRTTVELDDDGTGTFRVTSVVVELPEGPETVTAE